MKSKMVTLENNMNIHFLQKGSNDNPPLVLLHGWPSSCYLWRRIIPGLSRRFCVFAPDLPGHGKSDKPLDVDYDLNFLYEFLHNFYNAVGIEKANLVAHDLGGMAAIAFAVRNPRQIEKLVIMDTGPYSDWPFSLKFSLMLLKNKALTTFFLNRFVFAQILKSGAYDKEKITKDVVDMFRSPWIETRQGGKTFSKTIAVPPERMVEPVDRIKSIDVETMILWGGNDRFFPFRVAKRLHQDIKGSKLIRVQKAGHFLQEEKPEFIESQLIKFIVGKKRKRKGRDEKTSATI